MKKRTHCIRTITILAILAMQATAMAPALRADAPPCPAGTDRFAEYRLFFGRNQGTVEVVTDAAWRAFLAEEVTPRFPDGLTVMDAAGQWRDASGTIVRERSNVLLIPTEPGPAAMQRTDEIMQAYKRAFSQEAVLRAGQPPACRSRLGRDAGCSAPCSSDFDPASVQRTGSCIQRVTRQCGTRMTLAEQSHFLLAQEFNRNRAWFSENRR